MEAQLHEVVRLLVAHRWPFRLHATYDESIKRFLDVFEAVNREVPFDGLRWFFDHAETISDRNIDRVRALGGGIAIQHRMAYQGEYFVERYGAEAAQRTPPIAACSPPAFPSAPAPMRRASRATTRGSRSHWLVTGRTVGGTVALPGARIGLDRAEALRLYTLGSSWFSGEEEKKGAIVPGQLADLAVLSADYFSVAEQEITRIESVLTMVGGKVVYGTGEFAPLAPPLPPVSPSWSPAGTYGGYGAPASRVARPCTSLACRSRASLRGKASAEAAVGSARLRLLRVLIHPGRRPACARS